MSSIAFSYRDHTDPRGGGAVHGHHVVEQLRRLGHRLLTAEPRTDERLERRPRTLLGIPALLAEADLVYMRSQARPWDMALLGWNRGTRRRPVVLEINAIAEEELAYGNGALRRAGIAIAREEYRVIARAASAVVCVSDLLAEHVRATYGLSHDRLFVVPNGGTPAPAPPAPRDDGVFRVIWAGGTRWPWQALDTVLASARRLRAAVPEAESVLFADGPAPALAAEPGLCVRSAVPHPELQAELRRADVALCLYRPIRGCRAGFYHSPLKLFDGMAAGLPVVGSRLGQIAQVIRDGENGFLVDDDPASVAERLIALARDSARRRAMGAAALATIREGYTWDHSGDRLERAIRAALSAG